MLKISQAMFCGKCMITCDTFLMAILLKIRMAITVEKRRI
jgi:hypothetical protein